MAIKFRDQKNAAIRITKGLYGVSSFFKNKITFITNKISMYPCDHYSYYLIYCWVTSFLHNCVVLAYEINSFLSTKISMHFMDFPRILAVICSVTLPLALEWWVCEACYSSCDSCVAADRMSPVTGQAVITPM